MKSTYLVYLGGSHQDTKEWRKEFNKIATKKLIRESFQIKGIDPFKRNIDEGNNSYIVGRDIFTLMHHHLTHVIIKSSSEGAILSSGASFESLIAKYLCKPLIVIGKSANKKILPQSDRYLTDWYHPFVEYFSDTILPNTEAAIDWVINDIKMKNCSQRLGDQLLNISKQFKFSFHDLYPFAENNRNLSIDISLLGKATNMLPDNLISENHIVSALYHLFKELMPFLSNILIEKKYPYNNSKKCDIVLSYNGHEVWIEVKGYFKAETAQTRSRKHTSNFSSPIEACNRLSKLDYKTKKVLIIYQNVKYNPKSPNSWSELNEYCKGDNKRNKVELLHIAH